MTLRAIVDSLDNVPEELKQYYTERSGKFELTGEGIRTEADVTRVQESLRKEREDHKKLREKISTNLGDINIEDVRPLLDRIPELEVAAKGKLDEADIDKIVQSRVKSATAPTERQLTQAQKELADAKERISMFERDGKSRTIRDTILSITSGSSAKVKVIPEAVDDIMFYANAVLDIDESGDVRTRDGAGVTPGLPPELWLSDMLQKKPHWNLPSEGGGASGSQRGSGGGGPNPFSKDGWNLTEQGRLVTTDPKKAEQMARAAGTTVGGLRPTK